MAPAADKRSGKGMASRVDLSAGARFERRTAGQRALTSSASSFSPAFAKTPDMEMKGSMTAKSRGGLSQPATERVLAQKGVHASPCACISTAPSFCAARTSPCGKLIGCWIDIARALSSPATRGSTRQSGNGAGLRCGLCSVTRLAIIAGSPSPGHDRQYLD